MPAPHDPALLTRPRHLRAALAALALGLGMGAASAQEVLFDPSDYGRAQLPVRQSTGDAARFIAASEGGAFEPISELAPSDRMARLARPVGRVDILLTDTRTGEEGASACTGTLLGEGLVLTNHHCLPQSGPMRVKEASLLMDYLALDGEGSRRFALDPVPVEFSADFDYAIARVEGAPSTDYGTLPLGLPREGGGQARTVIHHPLGRPKVMSRFRCLALPDRSRMPAVAHRCDTLPGSSGSPVLDDTGRAVALHFAGGLDAADPSSFNSAVDMRALAQVSPIIGGLIESGGASVAADPTPAAPARPAAPAAPADGPLTTDRMNDILRGQ